MYGATVVITAGETLAEFDNAPCCITLVVIDVND